MLTRCQRTANIRLGTEETKKPFPSRPILSRSPACFYPPNLQATATQRYPEITPTPVTEPSGQTTKKTDFVPASQDHDAQGIKNRVYVQHSHTCRWHPTRHFAQPTQQGKHEVGGSWNTGRTVTETYWTGEGSQPRTSVDINEPLMEREQRPSCLERLKDSSSRAPRTLDSVLS